MNFTCPKCRQTLAVAAEMGSQLVQCPACNEAIQLEVVPREKAATQRVEKVADGDRNNGLANTSRAEIVMLPPVQESIIATVFSILGGIISVVGLLVAVSAFFSPRFSMELTLMSGFGAMWSGAGFIAVARLVQNTYESAQRLHRLELLLGQSSDRNRK